MKSRSHWLPVLEPHHDDWVDGSWTVDCICGVNFDDGEEMVNCDECGVWVHTHCSHYVKSEKSFACDKCKSKNNLLVAADGVGTSATRNNDPEETEVAEFLVELPTKTLRMGNPNPPSISSRAPSRLWAPMEERVHVQGVPGGGDLDLITGMSSVFGPHLWKAAGYVPKKFNSPYIELPCLGHGMDLEKNQAGNGTGCSFSQLKEKESNLPAPLVYSVGTRNPLVQQEKMLLYEKNLSSECVKDGVKKDIRSKQPITLYSRLSSKHKTEEIAMSKDLKKKSGSIGQDRDTESRTVNGSGTASKLSSDTELLDPFNSKGSRVAHNKFIHGKDGLAGSKGVGEYTTNLNADEHGTDATLIHHVASNQLSEEGIGKDQILSGAENAYKDSNQGALLTELNGSRSIPARKEILGGNPGRCEGVGGDSVRVGIASHNKECLAVVVAGTDSEPKERETGQYKNSEGNIMVPKNNLKADSEADIDGHGFINAELDGMMFGKMKHSIQHHQLTSTLLTEDCKAFDTSAIKSEANDHKKHDGNRGFVFNSGTDKCDTPGSTSNYSQGCKSLEGSGKARKRSTGTKHGSESSDEPLKITSATTCTSRSYLNKDVSLEKSASPTTSNLSKLSIQNVSSTAQNPTTDSSQKEYAQNSTEGVKDNPSTEVVEAEQKFSRKRKVIKDSPRLSSVSNAAQLKLQSSLELKGTLSDSQDIKLHSSRVSSVLSVTAMPLSGDSSSSTLMEGASDVHHKAKGSPPVKVEKLYQPSNHLISRGNVAVTKAPDYSNDEQYALYIHHQLNSSPRLPRVPRTRHAGSLPQTTCSTATSLPIKRTSSGGKDQGMLYRRKKKDHSKDAIHVAAEGDSEARRDRKSSVADKRKRDAGIDPFSRREAENSSVRDLEPTKVTNVSNSLSLASDANAQNAFGTCHSASDSRPINHTLPGLIADIMKEGKRISIDDLCDAVEPHWPHLRKHNGEPYAYSTPAQAVLDCLRNRSEWSSLVDRGPKTSAGRRRRRTDPDSLSIESEDNGDDNENIESQQEDLEFPKGKRKARKARRLTLKGRAIARRRRRADVVSDDESESDPDSCEENNVSGSDEEMQGGGDCIAGMDASVS